LSFILKEYLKKELLTSNIHKKKISHMFVSMHDPQTIFANKRYSAINSNMQSMINHFEASVYKVAASNKTFHKQKYY